MKDAEAVRPRKVRQDARTAAQEDEPPIGQMTGGAIDLAACPGCNERKSPRFKLCKACFGEYGRTADNWPEWLRFRVANDRRFRDASGQDAKNRLPWDGLERAIANTAAKRLKRPTEA